MHQPLAMDEYLSGRMIRDPMCIYDCDVPVDGSVEETRVLRAA